jgi:spore germination protein YaaH
MKRVVFLLLVIIGIGFLVVNGIKAKVKHDLDQPFVSTSQSENQKTVKRIPASGNDTTSLFVPYWTLANSNFNNEVYDAYLYFGITPTKNGINTEDAGYTKLNQFTTAIPEGKKNFLVIRMIESDINTAILKNTATQKKVIDESISLAKEQGFDGVVLDLELSAIPFDSLITQIREFNTLFYNQTKASNLSYGIAIYGDTFYRLRPFDIKAIAQKTDSLYVMAYDFHKSRGNPGPNFPLQGKDTYGYDMAEMSEDFLEFAKAEKITVVFGLFGYDWVVDNKGSATEHGDPLTLNEISSRFLNGCDYTNCEIKRDTASGETQIKYTDEVNVKHVVWFEDMDSVRAKEAFLRSKGINTFSFWANSYF